MEDPNAYFKKGSEVEISSNDEGFRGAWYLGTVLRPPSSTTGTKSPVAIEYKTLMAEEGSTKPLRETVDVVQLRPPPPRENQRSFKFSEEVDAYYNDGWWEGVITEIVENKRYHVFFRGTREQLEFGDSDLRLHREWVRGKWVPPLEEEVYLGYPEKPVSHEVAKLGKKMVEKGEEEEIREGALVEVCSDEDGFQGAWFAAIVIEKTGADKFLIEYLTLRNDDDTEFLREEAHRRHIRPEPPVIKDDDVNDRFDLLEEVDGLFNEGWWVGVISKVLPGGKYIVYFRDTKEELEFQHSDLRVHQEWINGKWVRASEALRESKKMRLQ